jgi:hypothetical protein
MGNNYKYGWDIIYFQVGCRIIFLDQSLNQERKNIINSRLFQANQIYYNS